MSLDIIVWLSVTLFLVHEFEEIIFIRPWLRRHRDEPRARQQVFWSWRNTSTATIAAMIFEEYLLVTAFAFVAVLANQPALFAGFLVPYALHLIGHIAEAITLRMRTPSVITSIATLPWCVYAIIELTSRSSAPVMVAVWAAASTVLIAANFALIYRLGPTIDRHLTGETEPSDAH